MPKRQRVQCLPGEAGGPYCTAGLLYGVACCAGGDCLLCETATRRLAEGGFSALRVSELLVATWYSSVTECPICRRPPPPVPRPAPPLPRWVRRVGSTYASAACLICGEPLMLRQRVVCSWQCWMDYRSEAEGFEFSGFTPMPRTFHVGEPGD